jgi:hypothetical protein
MGRFGFGFGQHTIGYKFHITERFVLVPEWFPSFIWLGIAIQLIRRVWKHRRSITGNWCVKCGYDLRATLERCPECGSVPTKQNNFARDQDTL